MTCDVVQWWEGPCLLLAAVQVSGVERTAEPAAGSSQQGGDGEKKDAEKKEFTKTQQIMITLLPFLATMNERCVCVCVC